MTACTYLEVALQLKLQCTGGTTSNVWDLDSLLLHEYWTAHTRTINKQMHLEMFRWSMPCSCNISSSSRPWWSFAIMPYIGKALCYSYMPNLPVTVSPWMTPTMLECFHCWSLEDCEEYVHVRCTRILSQYVFVAMEACWAITCQSALQWLKQSIQCLCNVDIVKIEAHFCEWVKNFACSFVCAFRCSSHFCLSYLLVMFCNLRHVHVFTF